MRKVVVPFFGALVPLTFVTGAFAQSTYYVTPSGDTSGATDMANIREAFEDAKTDGPGSVVQLGAGTFYIGGSIFVDDFYGTFTGAGMDETILESIPERPIDDPYFFYRTDGRWIYQNHHFLLSFGNGDYTISDMTISHPHWPAVQSNAVTWQFAYALNIMGPIANSVVERISIEGAPVGTSFTTFCPLFVQGVRPIPGRMLWFEATTGTHEVRASRIRNAVFGIEAGHLEDASVIIGGSGRNRNHIENVAYGYQFFGVKDSYLEFSHNKVVGARAFGVWNHPYKGRDPAIENTTVVVSHNNIEMGPWGQYSVALLGVDGPVITNNRVSGDGYGIFMWGSDDCLIRGNNVQHLLWDAGGIWLYGGTSGCRVIGNTHKVFDYGIDNYVVGHGRWR